MSDHYCTGSILNCALCDQAAARIEWHRGLDDTDERATRRDEARLEARVYGESRGDY